MSIYNLLFAGSVILIIFLMSWNGLRRVRPSSELVSASGTVIGSEFRLMGDGAALYIDIKYTFDGIDYFSFDLDANSFSNRGFGVGSDVAILIDPSNPRECRVERSRMEERMLVYLARRLNKP